MELQKRALVCGASSGIGREIALELSRQGVQCILLARRIERLQEVQREIVTLSGPQPILLVGDLEKMGELLPRIDELLQEGPIHILINNTGGPKGGPLIQAQSEEFLCAFQRHVIAAHLLTQKLVPSMEQSGFGRIINIVSTSVYEPIPNLGVSNTIRGAMASWSKSLSRELPPKVTINNVLPGFTDTERLTGLQNGRAKREGVEPEKVKQNWLSQVPEGRLAQPQETAKAVCFLASADASYIRGVSLAVDGGRLRSI
jgi:3-oxoacyl-[acyl-carrier protein] reductase